MLTYVSTIIKRVKKYGIFCVLKVGFNNKILLPVDRFLFKIAKKIWGKSKLRDVIILESHNDFDSNGGAFYDYLIYNNINKAYKIIWFVRNKCPDNLPQNVYCYNYNIPNLKKNYYNCIAKYILYCHVPIQKVQKDQIVVYMTHGPFGLKNFKGKVVLPQDVTSILCPSEYVAPILADQYQIGYPNEKQIFLGYPMHDCLYEDGSGDFEKISRKYYDCKVLWMPTFRKTNDFHRNDSTAEFPLGLPIFKTIEELEELNKMLISFNAILIIKIHPMQDRTTVKIGQYSNIVVLDANSVKHLNINNYKLMKDVDALISDYSSVAYDYLHLNRPIAYTMDDINDYKLGLLFDNPQEFLAGPILNNSDDFVKFIVSVISREDSFEEKRKEVLKRVFKYQDGESSRRLAEYIGI